jgi:hypothetical protein
LRFPADWPRGRESDNGDGIQLYGGDPDVLISAFASQYSVHSVPYGRLREAGFRAEPFLLNDGTQAQLVLGRENGQLVRDMVVITRGVEFHVYAKVSEAFFRANEAALLRVMKGLRVFRPAFASGGLGLARSDWEHLHGRPVKEDEFVHYESGSLVVAFMEDNVWHLERVWGDLAAVSLETAQDVSQRFIPTDAHFVQRYTARGERPVDLYLSETLRSRFSADRWMGGSPGNFIVLYRTRTDGFVTSLVIGIGNNP